ncbi:endonuclease/exonuclease/phosphatase family protein [Sinorhizobium sp. 7-81]|uniref:endonuclease/exonuclease/phosphatase family protein n=1 Tax=Sinorhizobium sp. 8-89 TaxID=3049089 RepID=UPI0024C46A52|nr:endonuclease/exonuclease/phosphatase family protein [Sinorhizobium sp. 8-89]MDK1494587.1 endonuclease/exonuclease/phosphatase family protein [Sinorhizobium sp. 8-89]
MRVITYNIQYGKGRDDRYDIDRTIQALPEADIICLQEIEAHWGRSGNINQVEHIAKHLGFFTIFGATVDVHKRLLSSDGSVRYVRRQFGNAIFSRWPILATRTFLLPKLNPLNAHSIQRGITEATIETAIGPLRVYTSHFSHLCDEERSIHAAFALDVHRRAIIEGPVMNGDHPDKTWLEEPPPDVPTNALLMGDLNFTPSSPVYSMLAGGTSHMYGRLHLPDAFVDTWVAAGNAADEGHTAYRDWHAKTGKRIDYVFASSALAPQLKSAEVLSDVDASDHQPLIVTFDI